MPRPPAGEGMTRLRLTGLLREKPRAGGASLWLRRVAMRLRAKGRAPEPSGSVEIAEEARWRPRVAKSVTTRRPIQPRSVRRAGPPRSSWRRPEQGATPFAATSRSSTGPRSCCCWRCSERGSCSCSSGFRPCTRLGRWPVLRSSGSTPSSTSTACAEPGRRRQSRSRRGLPRRPQHLPALPPLIRALS
jgi:hypothetical protein